MILDGIRKKIGAIFLNKKIEQITREREVQNIDTASNALVVFDLNGNIDHVHKIFSFIVNLNQSKIKVDSICFTPSKRILKRYTGIRGLNIIMRKDLNWFFKPNNENVNRITNKKYDLLIDLSSKPQFPIEWIIAVTEAKFKVGNFNHNHVPFDLLVNTDIKKDGFEYYIQQVQYFITKINNN